MAGSTTNINIQMDSDLKAQADALFGELGMDLSTAFNIFVRQALREGRIPFNISLNQSLKKFVEKGLNPDRSKRFKNVSEMKIEFGNLT